MDYVGAVKCIYLVPRMSGLRLTLIDFIKGVIPLVMQGIAVIHLEMMLLMKLNRFTAIHFMIVYIMPCQEISNHYCITKSS